MARVPARAIDPKGCKLNSLNGSVHLPSWETEAENAFQPRPFVSADPIAETNRQSVSSVIGSDLTVSDYAELEARWIDRAWRSKLPSAESIP